MPSLRQSPLVLLDDSRPAHRAGRSLLFDRPDEVITASTLDEVPAALAAMDGAHARGLHLAGWIAYECAAHFEPRLATSIKSMPDEPLIWMIATKHRRSLDSHAVAEALRDGQRGNQRRARLDVGKSAVTHEDYMAAIGKVHEFIRAGDVYQINYTFPLPCRLEGDSLALYGQLRKSQPVPYGAYMNTGDWTVLSLSPELFLRRRGNLLLAKPMKGTAPRGLTLAADEAVMHNLAADEKSRAENLMIVDLIRNDLSRLAEPGSVKVSSLFEVERYKSLHQMTSSVQATARQDLVPSKLLAALFPCGSVTGAPKVRAMEIIAALEQAPRGVYCGAIGHFSPATDRLPADWALNVPIRTMVLDDGGTGRLSVGSGVVADSSAAGEYDECLLKARFARSEATPFSLIETFKLAADGTLPRFDQHLARLAASAAYFDFAFDRDRVAEAVAQHRHALGAGAGPRRMRLLLSQDGAVSVTSLPLGEPAAGMAKVCLSDTPVRSDDPFLFHKTTNRRLYDGAIARARAAGFDDMLFFNERDELTEGAVSTVFIVKDGQWLTPPLQAGLLPGILRQELLQSHSPEILEHPVSRADLMAADTVYIGNSLRGLREATVELQPI